MKNYVICGGKKLKGSVKISGSKNAALPIIATSILNGGTTILKNTPDISDIKIMLEILKNLGCNVEQYSDKIIINSKDTRSYEIPKDLMHKMRSSVSIVGALISRFGKCSFTYPGGCDIGKRPIDMHLKAFSQLGVDIKMKDDLILCSSNKLMPDEINLKFPSVGATENIMISSVFINGKTIIKNAAKEPEIIDLQKILNKMGAKIKGAGTDTIIINGVKTLKDVEYEIMPDRIETGTILCAVASSGRRSKCRKCCIKSH